MGLVWVYKYICGQIYRHSDRSTAFVIRVTDLIMGILKI